MTPRGPDASRGGPLDVDARAPAASSPARSRRSASRRCRGGTRRLKRATSVLDARRGAIVRRGVPAGARATQSRQALPRGTLARCSGSFAAPPARATAASCTRATRRTRTWPAPLYAAARDGVRRIAAGASSASRSPAPRIMAPIPRLVHQRGAPSSRCRATTCAEVAPPGGPTRLVPLKPARAAPARTTLQSARTRYDVVACGEHAMGNARRGRRDRRDCRPTRSTPRGSLARRDQRVQVRARPYDRARRVDKVVGASAKLPDSVARRALPARHGSSVGVAHREGRSKKRWRRSASGGDGHSR